MTELDYVNIGVMPDSWIREQSAKGMITPFESEQVRLRERTTTESMFHVQPMSHSPCRMQGCSAEALCEVCAEIAVVDLERRKVISYGTSSYGYDMRVADEYKVFANVHGTLVVDPKHLDERCFHEVKNDHCIIPPNSFALARSVERFQIPPDVMVLCIGKSTYARCGIVIGITPMEPGWGGYLTIEISNTTPLPCKIYSNEGIAQALFFKSGRKCDTSYSDRNGKYQNQPAQIVLPKV